MSFSVHYLLFQLFQFLIIHLVGKLCIGLFAALVKLLVYGQHMGFHFLVGDASGIAKHVLVLELQQLVHILPPIVESQVKAFLYPDFRRFKKQCRQAVKYVYLISEKIIVKARSWNICPIMPSFFWNISIGRKIHTDVSVEAVIDMTISCEPSTAATFGFASRWR